MYKSTQSVIGKINKLTSDISLKMKSNMVREFLQESEIIPHIQPVFGKNGETVIGCEALLRIRNNGELLTPSYFIRDLENYNMLDEVVCQIFRSVIVFFDNYKMKFPTGFYFAFNIYAGQLKSRAVVDEILSFNNLYEDTGLVIEIVDRGVVQLDDEAIAIMDTLMEHGVQFAIDDFGTGATQLKIIEHIGFSTIKVDRELTIHSCGELVYKNVIGAIVMLSHKLGIKVIADGVESSEQIKLLKDAGVDGMQGFFLAKPMEMDQFVRSYINR